MNWDFFLAGHNDFLESPLVAYHPTVMTRLKEVTAQNCVKPLIVSS